LKQKFLLDEIELFRPIIISQQSGKIPEGIRQWYLGPIKVAPYVKVIASEKPPSHS
jgi:hypothetical protein